MSTRHRPAASRTMAIRAGRTHAGSAGRPRTSERARPRTSKPAGRGGAAVEVDMGSTVAAACKSRLLNREEEAKTLPQRIRNARLTEVAPPAALEAVTLHCTLRPRSLRVMPSLRPVAP